METVFCFTFICTEVNVGHLSQNRLYPPVRDQEFFYSARFPAISTQQLVVEIKKYGAIGSGWPGVDLRFFPWLLLAIYCTGWCLIRVPLVKTNEWEEAFCWPITVKQISRNVQIWAILHPWRFLIIVHISRHCSTHTPCISHWPLPAVCDLTHAGRWSTYDVNVLKLSNVSFWGNAHAWETL